MQPKVSPLTKTQPITKPKQDLQPDKLNEKIDPKIKAIEDELKKQGENSKSLIGKLKDKIDGLIGIVGKAKAVKDVVTKPSALSSLLTFTGTGLGLSATVASVVGIGIPLTIMFIKWRGRRKEKKQNIGTVTEQISNAVVPINGTTTGSVYSPIVDNNTPSQADDVLRSENDQLRAKLNACENEQGKLRKYVQIPIDKDVELYRRAFDIVVKQEQGRPSVLRFHKLVEEHFQLLKSGRGV